MERELSPEDEQILAMARANREADRITAKNMEKIRFAAWWHWGFGLLCVTVAVAWVQTQNRIKDLGKENEKQEIRIQGHENWKFEHQQSTNLRDERLLQLRKDFEDYRAERSRLTDERIKQHDQMWWMYQMRATPQPSPSP